MSQMTEIRWHGRAGQGVVTAGELLAEVAMTGGKFFQAFPEYGSERMGAPIKCYTRISDEPIEIHCPVLEPDVVLVVNPNLLGVVDITEGLKEDGIVIINTSESPEALRKQIGFETGQLWTVPASDIALEELKRDIPSTMMLGVIAKATGLISLEAAVEVAGEKLGAKLRPEVVQANVRSIERAFNECVKG